MELNNVAMRYFERYMSAIGIIGHSIFIFQTYKVLQTHSSEDISLLGFTMAFISICSWLFYGLVTHDKVLVRVNIFGFAVALVCILSIIFVRLY
ncbi:MAG: hypothetical protein J0G32_01215 [Alphaproteobacteria bacterium]|nr:hypothetical protein [Alphaproteobacteria bacterium]OJV15274.1 MAG: hypothetical protein BGO27_02060 [Alphaproteobacteria bacterium 33-17]